MKVGRVVTSLLIAAGAGLAPTLGAAQSVGATEREALVRLRVERGGRAEDVDALIRRADEAAAKGLPVAPLTNKIREGLAKGHDPQRIDGVIRQITIHLDAADQLIRGLRPPPAAAGRDAAVTLLAEAFAGGLTPDEVRELSKQVQAAGKPMAADAVANAARGLAFIKDAGLPVSDGTAVIAEAVRQGFRSHEVLAVGREVKRREADYRAGRASLRAVRDAIARGDRPDQLFRDSRPESAERPAATRPETVERPERAPERPTRPERQRPETPERPGVRR